MKNALEIKTLSSNQKNRNYDDLFNQLDKRIQEAALCGKQEYIIKHFSIFQALLSKKEIRNATIHKLEQLGYRVIFRNGLYTDETYMVITWAHIDLTDEKERERLEREEINRQLIEIHESMQIKDND